MVKKYIVELTAVDKKQLLDLTRKGKTSARKLKRAQILLLANEGKIDEDICAGLHVGLATVERIRKRLVLEGLDAALNERPRPGGQRKLSPKGEAVLEAISKMVNSGSNPEWRRASGPYRRTMGHHRTTHPRTAETTRWSWPTPARQS